MTLRLPLQPREPQNISHSTARADSVSVISSLLEVTLLILAALNYHQTSAFLIINNDVSKSVLGFNYRLRRLLCRVLIVGRQSYQEEHSGSPQLFGALRSFGERDNHNLFRCLVASPEPQIVTIDSDSNEPTFPYGFRNQNPIVPPSLNDLNLPHNPFNAFNVLATMAVIRQDEEEPPQSLEPSDPSPFSTQLMNVSTIEGMETPHTTTNDNTFYSSEGEPRRVYWDFSPDETFDSNEPTQLSPASIPSFTPPRPPRQKRKLRMGMSFPQKGECRSTPARHPASPYQPKRHPNAQ